MSSELKTKSTKKLMTSNLMSLLRKQTNITIKIKYQIYV